MKKKKEYIEIKSLKLLKFNDEEFSIEERLRIEQSYMKDYDFLIKHGKGRVNEAIVNNLQAKYRYHEEEFNQIKSIIIGKQKQIEVMKQKEKEFEKLQAELQKEEEKHRFHLLIKQNHDFFYNNPKMNDLFEFFDDNGVAYLKQSEQEEMVENFFDNIFIRVETYVLIKHNKKCFFNIGYSLSDNNEKNAVFFRLDSATDINDSMMSYLKARIPVNSSLNFNHEALNFAQEFVDFFNREEVVVKNYIFGIETGLVETFFRGIKTILKQMVDYFKPHAEIIPFPTRYVNNQSNNHNDSA
jgi:hypothetical protein